MPESTQHKLDRVRPPRVQITYDVEIGDAIVMKELPFVVGIMADLSGDNAAAKKPLKERKYVEIDRDNFNDIMYSIEPSLKLSVTNKLKDDPKSLVANLTFKNLDDFSPINVLKQVPELNELFDARTRLSDLATKLDGNDRLEEAINHALFIGVGDDSAKKTLDEAIKNASAAPAQAGDKAAADKPAKAGKGAAETATAETPAADAAPKTDDAKPLSAKQKREALQKLLTDRKDAAELKEATTYASELKGLEKAVADAEKELKKLRETAKRKARLEGKELPEDGGSDDE